jgi:hypothetical protein
MVARQQINRTGNDEENKMSVEVMSMVFKRYPHGGGERVLALALADHAHDDGSRVFPSVALLAKKSMQSARTVQYQLRKMEAMGWLIKVSDGSGGRSNTTEYCISPDWLKGAILAPFISTKRVQSTTQRVQPDVLKGATAIAPEPSITITNPLKPSVESKSRPPEKITFDADANKFTIPLSCYDAWENVFPKLDLDAEIDKAELWLSANPKRRKKNYERFLAGWFSRAVENAKPRVFVKTQPAALAR